MSAPTLQEPSLALISRELYDAQRNATPVAPLSARWPGLTLEDAYAIQQGLIDLRVTRDGERIIGRKIGVTSQAVMDLLQVNQPDFGVLTSAMLREDGAAIATDTLIAPRAEGEIAFLLGRDLHGPGVTIDDVLRATELVLPCLEIVDSRIADWQIAIQDTVADNASSALFVPGPQAVSPRGLDLALLGMTLERNGDIVVTGAGAASLGHPARAVAWLANTLGAFGEGLKQGDIVLSGAMGAMVPVQSGDHIALTIGQLGSASARFI